MGTSVPESASTVVVDVAENWSTVPSVLFAAAVVESLRVVSVCSVCATFSFSALRSVTISLICSLSGLSGSALRSARICAFVLFTLVSALPVAPLAVSTPLATRVADVLALPLACRNRLPPWSSSVDRSLLNEVIPPCVFVSRPDALVSPWEALVAAESTPASVLRRSAIIVRDLLRLAFVASSFATVCATVALPSCVICTFVVLIVSVTALLTVETKALFTWRAPGFELGEDHISRSRSFRACGVGRCR